MHPDLILALLSAASSTKKSTSSAGGSSFFLIILVLFVALYFLVLRPRNKRMRQQTGSRNALEVGDEVVTAGGILGTVTAIDGDEISVEVAPGVIMNFWRRAVNQRSSVAGAPPSRLADADGPADEAHRGVDDRFDEPEPGDHRGVDDRYDEPDPADEAAADGGTNGWGQLPSPPSGTEGGRTTGGSEPAGSGDSPTAEAPRPWAGPPSGEG